MKDTATLTTPKPGPRKRGEGSIYQRGETWWIAYYRRGKQKRESSYSTNREDAERLLDRKTKQLWAEKQGLQAFVPKAEKVYVDELLDALEKAYKVKLAAKLDELLSALDKEDKPARSQLLMKRGLAQFRSHLKPIREAFGDIRAVDVTTKRVDDYIDQRLEEDNKKAPATVNRETQLLGQAFGLGIEDHRIVAAPHIRHLPERNVRKGFFERGDFEAVVAKLPVHLQNFARFGHIAAWRRGQIASLTWADVDRDVGVIVARAEHVKNGHEHKIPLEGELAEIIERCWIAREYKTPDGRPALSQYVFHRKGAPIGEFKKSWARACHDAGLPCELRYKKDFKGRIVLHKKGPKKGQPVIEEIRSKMIFHDLRRTGVRNMVRAGVREGVAMAISGHRTRSVFDRYNITSDEDLRQAVKQTTEHVKSQPALRKVVAIGKK
jgi:integrase